MKHFVGLLALIFSISCFAEKVNCQGNWTVEIQSPTSSLTGLNYAGVWLPALITVTNQLQNCATQVRLKPINGAELKLKGPGGDLATQFLDKKKNLLSQSIAKTGYIIPLNRTGITTFWIKLPAGNYATAGRYFGMIEAVLDTRDSHRFSRKQVEVRYYSEPFVTVTIDSSGKSWFTGSGNGYSIDFGTLKQGVRREFDFLIRSNTQIRMSLRSEKGGLANVRSPGMIVPYYILIDGQRLSPKGHQIFQLGEVGSRQLSRIPFGFEIGNVDFARAGQYRDIVAVNVMAY